MKIKVLKNLKKLFILSCLILVFSCRNEECFTPPENIVFEFVNSSGENLIQNGTLDQSKIRIQQDNRDGNTVVIKSTIREDHKISIQDLGFYEGTKSYEVYLIIDPVKKFNFTVTSSKIMGKCSGYIIDKLLIENIDSKKENGYYKIVVE